MPLEMNKLSMLKIVDLSYNPFTSIPDVVAGMKNLKTLDISFNKLLAGYPAEIKNLKELRLLNLKNTKITAKQVDDLEWLIPECKLLL